MTSNKVELMEIEWDAEAIVVSRPNRFVMIADIFGDDGSMMEGERVHVHDPGRLKEIIFTGNRVRLRRSKKEGRKTGWTLISGKVNDDWVLVNSSFHRRISETILGRPDLSPIENIADIRPEVKIGNSRLDFKITRNDGTVCYIEVKGCSLSIDGRALFPDAPTTRGRRHVEELTKLKKEGVDTAILILVLAPNTRIFSPNSGTDPDFSRAMENAHHAGVRIIPVDLNLVDGHIMMGEVLPFDFI